MVTGKPASAAPGASDVDRVIACDTPPEPHDLLLLLVPLDHPGTEVRASISHVCALPIERHHVVAVIEDNHLRKAPEFALQEDRIADVALVIKARVEDQCGLLDLA